jgi:dolichol-phosphate mannosyltransferase
LQAIQVLKPNVTIIKLSKNFGAIAASNAGLKQVKGDAFTFFAGDLQDPPHLLLTMVNKWLEGSNYIICQRNKKRKDPLLTKLYAYLYYKLIRFFVVKNFPKTGFDIMFWDSKFLNLFQNSSKNINRSLYAHWLGVKPEVVLYDRPERGAGESKWTFSKKINLFIDSFVGFSIIPIRLSMFIGLLSALVSFSYGTIVLFGGLFGNNHEPGYPSTIVIISFLLGIVITMLGVIGEYIWRIFDEVNKRPESVVEEVIS